jgi:hypothetical protein
VRSDRPTLATCIGSSDGVGSPASGRGSALTDGPGADLRRVRPAPGTTLLNSPEKRGRAHWVGPLRRVTISCDLEAMKRQLGQLARCRDAVVPAA